MGLKGIEFAVETVIRILGVLFIGLLIGVIIVNALGSLEGVRENFCRALPWICGADKESLKEEKARNSVLALVCALQSITEKTDMCGKEYTTTPFYETRATEETVECTGGLYKCRDLCKERCEIKGCIDYVFDENSCTARKTTLIGGEEEKRFFCSCLLKTSKKTSVWCKEDFSRCRVNNFFLEQDVSLANEWIKGFGDPLYLVYWESFPEGEDAAWNSRWNWVENYWDLGISFFVVGKIFKFTKPAKIVTIPVKAGANYIKNAVGIKTAEEIGTGIAASAAKAGKARVAALGLAGAANYFAAYFDSIVKKYEHYDNSLVLKSPYTDPVAYNVGDIPVVLEKNNFVYYFEDSYTPFYLASPCKTNLNLREDYITCNPYVYYPENGIYVCNPMKTESDLNCINSDNPVEILWEDFVTKRIKELKEERSKDRLKIVKPLVTNGEGIQNIDGLYPAKRFVINDIINNVYFVVKVNFKNNYNLEEVGFSYSNGIKTFSLSNSYINEERNGFQTIYNKGWKYEDDAVRVFVETRDDGSGEGAVFKINRFDVRLKDCTETWCKEVKETADRIEGVYYFITTERFSVMEEERETAKIDIKSNIMAVFMEHDGKRSVVVLKDLPDITKITTGLEDSNALLDGIADYIAIDRRNWFGFNFGSIISGDEDFAIIDENKDGKFDRVVTMSCKKKGIIVTLEKLKTGERNFCVSEKSVVYYGFEYAPVLGMGLGAVIGGVLGGAATAEAGAIGIVPGALKGADIGSSIGAFVTFGYKLYVSNRGSKIIWPGEVY